MMKLGQRVYLQFDPETWGTVSAVEDSRFQVTWFGPERKPGKPRIRHWYTASALTTIRRGVPE